MRLVCIQLMSSINHVDQGQVHHFILHIASDLVVLEHNGKNDEIPLEIGYELRHIRILRIGHLSVAEKI